MEDYNETRYHSVDTEKYNPNKVIVNYLPDALNDHELSSLFGTIGPVKSTKVVCEKATGVSLGFGFVEFESVEDARRAIEKFDGLSLQQKRLKVAYARWPGTPETVGANVHVRNLESTVSVQDVEQQFSQYGEIVRARVLNDPQTGLSRGIAFVLFGNREEAEHAVNALNGASIPGFARGALCVRFALDSKTKAQVIYAANAGVLPGGIAGFPAPHRMATGVTSAGQQLLLGSGYGTAHGGGPIRAGGIRQRFNPMAGSMANTAALASISGVSNFRPRNDLRVPNAAFGVHSMRTQLRSPMRAAVPAAAMEHPVAGLATGHIIFVYNLRPDADERDLWQLFAPFGAVQKVNIIMDTEKNKCKGYGFVTMTHFDEAMIAISQLNGFMYKDKQLQVSLKTPKQQSFPQM